MAVTPAKHAQTGSMSGRRDGLTLVEAMVSTLIVAVMLVAALTAFGGVARSHLVQKATWKGQALGWSLLAEVMQARYEDPNTPGGWGLDSGENPAPRSDFDDVDDYDGWTASPPQENDGTEFTDYAGWRRTVSVTLIDPRTLSFSFPQDLGLRKIEVTVADPHGNSAVFSGLRSRHGAGEKAPIEDTTSVTWAGLDLQIGDDASNRLQSGQALANQPTIQ